MRNDENCAVYRACAGGSGAAVRAGDTEEKRTVFITTYIAIQTDAGTRNTLRRVTGPRSQTAVSQETEGQRIVRPLR